MKKENKDKKNGFGATFTKKGAKQTLICMGCGEHFVHLPDIHTDECPFCMCIHCLHTEYVKGWTFKLLKDKIFEKHRWWKGFELVPECSADVVLGKAVCFLREQFGSRVLLKSSAKKKKEVKAVVFVSAFTKKDDRR